MAFMNGKHDAEVVEQLALAKRVQDTWLAGQSADERKTQHRSPLRLVKNEETKEMMTAQEDIERPGRTPESNGKVTPSTETAPAYPVEAGDGHRCPRCQGSTPFVAKDVLHGGLISGKRGFTAVKHCPLCGFAVFYRWRNF